MNAFWDNWFVPGLTTMGLHAVLAYLILSGIELSANKIIVIDTPDYVRATLVSKPIAKQAPKPRQALALEKPKIEDLAVPDVLPTVGEYAEPDALTLNSEAHTNETIDDEPLDLNSIMRAIEDEESLLLEQSDLETVGKHKTYIQLAIQSKWSRPPSSRNGMKVSLAIIMVPTGEVVSVNVTSSSGNPAFDRSAVNAVKQVGRFVELAELETRLFEEYFRELNLLFHPEDLLL